MCRIVSYIPKLGGGCKHWNANSLKQKWTKPRSETMKMMTVYVIMWNVIIIRKWSIKWRKTFTFFDVLHVENFQLISDVVCAVKATIYFGIRFGSTSYTNTGIAPDFFLNWVCCLLNHSSISVILVSFFD